MDFFKLFSIRIHLKRKYKTLLICSIIFIILFHILSVLGYCASELEPDGVIEGAFLSDNSVLSNASSSASVFYWNIQKNHSYTLTNTSSANRFYAFSDEVPAVGITTLGRKVILPHGSFTFIADNDYLLFGNYAEFSLIDNGSVETSMPVVLGNLITVVNQDTLGQVFVDSIPYIVIIVLFGFGFFAIVMLFRMIRKGE